VFTSQEVEVIKVTVDRREKRLQDYAGSASAHSEDDLERQNITSLRDLSAIEPSMEIGVVEGNTEVFIRGVGTNDSTELGDPAAATHIDGIYIPRPRGVGEMFYDLERVEVNRGPQGTLRGRNATAGTVNIVTAKPKLKEWGAEAGLQFGNYSQILTRGMVNVPLGETLAFRAATFSENREGFYKNAGPVIRKATAESAGIMAYRLGLQWVPVKQLTVQVGHDWMQNKGTGVTGSNFNAPLSAGLLPQEIKEPRTVVANSGPQPQEFFYHWGVHGDITADLGPVEVQYLGSYRNLHYNQVTGGGTGVDFPGRTAATPDQIDDWDASYWRTTSQSQVHELRFFSPDSARLRWTVGGFLFHETQEAFLGQTADQSNTFAGVEFNQPDVKGDSQAGYADATFDVTKELRATAGLRFTHETKERHGLGAVWLINGVNADGSNFRFGTEGFRFAAEGRTLYPSQPITDPALAKQVFLNGIGAFGVRDNLNQRLASGTFNAGAITPESGSYSDNFLDWRVGIDYDVAKDHLVYGNVSTGHKSGGFNDNTVVTFPDGHVESLAPTYKPESLTALEVGSKNQFSDLGLRFNAAVFYYFYRDQVFQTVQQIATVPDPTGLVTQPASTVRFNAAKSHVVGIEVDGSYQLPLGFVLAATGTFLEAKFDEGSLFDNRVAFGPTSSLTDHVDISGNDLPRAPRLAVNYSLAQTIRTSIGWFDWIASAQSRTRQFMTVFNGNGVDPQGNVNPNLSDEVPGYTRLDLSAGYTRPDGKLRIRAFCTNVTDVAYMTTLINTPGLNLRFFNPPRQVGAQMQLDY
jgi:iron complex outermembrane receptor protein